MRFAESLWLLRHVLGAARARRLLVALGGVLGQRAVRRFGDAPLVTALVTARAGGRRALKGVLLVLALCARVRRARAAAVRTRHAR